MSILYVAAAYASLVNDGKINTRNALKVLDKAAQILVDNKKAFKIVQAHINRWVGDDTLLAPPGYFQCSLY